MIKYLAKFVSESKFAEELLDGQLYMNAAGYYHTLEKGQGDRAEGAFSHTSMMFMNVGRPIFCMYCVEEEDVKDNETLITEKIITDFNCENGYIVLIEYESFINKLSELDVAGYCIIANKVTYRTIGLELSKELITDTEMNNLFIKHSYFSHQKEYRVVVGESLTKILGKQILDYREVDVLIGYNAKKYSFKTNNRSIAKCIKVSSLERKDKNYILPLSV